MDEYITCQWHTLHTTNAHHTLNSPRSAQRCLSNSNTTALVRDLDESMQRIDPARRYPFPPSTPVRILDVAVELGLVDRGTVWMSEHVAQVRD